eukprot:1209020-Rhodomonas_salina.2
MRGYSSLGDRDDLPVSSSTCAACNAMRGADTALGAQGTPKTSFPLPGDFHDLPMHALRYAEQPHPRKRTGPILAIPKKLLLNGATYHTALTSALAVLLSRRAGAL